MYTSIFDVLCIQTHIAHNGTLMLVLWIVNIGTVYTYLENTKRKFQYMYFQIIRVYLCTGAIIYSLFYIVVCLYELHTIPATWKCNWAAQNSHHSADGMVGMERGANGKTVFWYYTLIYWCVIPESTGKANHVCFYYELLRSCIPLVFFVFLLFSLIAWAAFSTAK